MQYDPTLTLLRTAEAWVSLSTGLEEGGPIGQRLLIGAFQNPATLTGWNDLVAEVGAPLDICRSYSPNMPVNWAATTGALLDGTEVAQWHSCKIPPSQLAAGMWNSEIQAFALSCPVDRPVWLTVNHEPEDDGISATDWRNGQIVWFNNIKAVRPDILVGPILMEWTFNPASGRNKEDWAIPPQYQDFYGVDTYNPYQMPAMGNKSVWYNAPIQALDAFTNWCNVKGYGKAIGEYGTAEDASGIGPTRKAEWLLAMADYAFANRFIGACYFNSYKAGDTNPTIVLNSSRQSLDAFKAGILTYQEV